MQSLARISAALSVRWFQYRTSSDVADSGGRTVVGLVAFHKTPSVYVNDLAPIAILTSQHIEAADHLTKTIADLRSPYLFLFCQTGDEAAGIE